MDQQEATEFVIRELGRHRSRDDIVREICEQTNWPWKQVQHFVQRVEVQHHDRITGRQMPLLIALGVGTVVAGFLLVVFAIYSGLSGEGSSLPYALVGLGMLIGGIAGIWRAVGQWREAQ
jgi:hypothetical protein